MRATLILATIAGVSVLHAAPAAAQSIPPAVEAACNADYKKLCSSVVPGGGRIIACMKAKDSQLSAGCRTALQDEEKKRAGGK
jgi:hypothetical protein